MNILGIIPARYGSTRLNGKPLADIAGKPMIQHVYERAFQALHNVIVATDDERIANAVEEFGGRSMMTSHEHNSGTNRCLEAYENYLNETGKKADVIINIQGDEPLLDPAMINGLANCFDDESVELATLITKVTDKSDLTDENNVFAVFDNNRDALYFSRSPIPHVRGVKPRQWFDHQEYYKHIGMYAYRPKALKHFASLPQSNLEKAEALEQNRWMEDGRKIRLEVTPHQAVSVDTPADLERVRKMMAG